jgi:hypothetical protein
MLQFRHIKADTQTVVIICSVLISICIFTGCGYVSTSAYLEHIKSIRISPVRIDDTDIAFDMLTQRPYDEIIREKLIDKFNQKWSDGNDAEFDLIIIDYNLTPLDYDANNRPIQFRMSLLIEYIFRDRVRNKIIDQKDNYLQVHDFYVVQGFEPPETREQAKSKLIEELTEDLYSELAEQW